jgi:hypothetical protein
MRGDEMAIDLDYDCWFCGGKGKLPVLWDGTQHDRIGEIRYVKCPECEGAGRRSVKAKGSDEMAITDEQEKLIQNHANAIIDAMNDYDPPQTTVEMFTDRIAPTSAALVDEFARLNADNERLRGLVKSLEWAYDGYCPSCGADQGLPHLDDCRVFTPEGDVK